MKTLIHLFILLTLSGACSLGAQKAWATEIHRCVGPDGEATFSEQPCLSQTSPGVQTANDVKVDTTALEAIRKRLIRVNRQESELEQVYQKQLLEVEVSKLEALIIRHKQQLAALNREKLRLQSQRDQLMSNAFDSYLSTATRGTSR